MEGSPPMDEYQALSHITWGPNITSYSSEVSKEDAVFGAAPTSRRSVPQVGRAEGVEDRGGHLIPDHVHMLISIPSKYAVSQVVGFIKGKSAIHLARIYGERKRNLVGQHFWARGYSRRCSALVFARLQRGPQPHGPPEIQPSPSEFEVSHVEKTDYRSWNT